MKNYFLLFFLFTRLVCWGQTDTVFHLDSLPFTQEYQINDPGIIVLTAWKYHKGDNTKWAESNFDDRSWKFIAPELNLPS